VQRSKVSRSDSIHGLTFNALQDIACYKSNYSSLGWSVMTSPYNLYKKRKFQFSSTST